ncbi:LytTR family transcriptional regulator DNA-binding domain-containing protein [Nodularia sphaerocarpa]|uniref:LytTR family transcriptional regulator DNA-binding domain-containing protein n=1 Tax=Nodularia sphaerocarpa TaxID=137816 RepID=UPI001EFAC763|nr:LytTR family transcriptional regulator DNA-binding domain-containing protein [Nodularia sphaerocarpa]MDB9372807.1 LytTR family transcriptional regulator DNA-binding domain-containing protein [Nodularia sphaerocarpa CS-585]ULP74153.1 hypothetical protein BDGGKGIB_03816 [Nodularia sphaerocarpa UHCC 0038]
MPSNFIKIGDDLIINTDQVTHIRKIFGGTVLVTMTNRHDTYIKLSDEKAEYVWNYFSSLLDHE